MFRKESVFWGRASRRYHRNAVFPGSRFRPVTTIMILSAVLSANRKWLRYWCKVYNHTSPRSGQEIPNDSWGPRRSRYLQSFLSPGSVLGKLFIRPFPLFSLPSCNFIILFQPHEWMNERTFGFTSPDCPRAHKFRFFSYLFVPFSTHPLKNCTSWRSFWIRSRINRDISLRP